MSTIVKCLNLFFLMFFRINVFILHCMSPYFTALKMHLLHEALLSSFGVLLCSVLFCVRHIVEEMDDGCRSYALQTCCGTKLQKIRVELSADYIFLKPQIYFNEPFIVLCPPGSQQSLLLLTVLGRTLSKISLTS